MKFFIFIIILSAQCVSSADEMRRTFTFKSANEKFELKAIAKRLYPPEWILTEKSTGGVRYKITGDFSAMTVLVSDDGESLVTIDDYSERERAKNLDVLSFYRAGKLLKTYTLGELLNDIGNIESSVSHFTWFFGIPSLKKEKLNFKTYELVDYTFDMETGSLINKERDEALNGDALYIYGKMKNLGNGFYEMKVCHRIQGIIPKNGVVKFEAVGPDRFLTNHYSTVIVKGGRLVAEPSVILNSCNYQR